MFNVYVSAILLTSKDRVDKNQITTQENKEPLNAEQAVRLARECTKRISIGYVKIVDITNDTIAFEWHYMLGIAFHGITLTKFTNPKK